MGAVGAQTTPALEAAALCSVYRALPPLQRLWASPCGWAGPCNSTLAGVTCSGGTVTRLVLPQSSGSGRAAAGGTIPEAIGDLGGLTELCVQSNGVSGTLPPSIGSLRKLSMLELQANRISGTIPDSLGNLTGLTFLGIVKNQVSGTIPDSLYRLQALWSWDLSENRLNGTISSLVGQLANLYSLGLNGNQISGTIPDSIGSLRNLHVVYLDANRLSGTIPTSLGGLTSINYLGLQHNSIDGTLPGTIGNLSGLQFLHLAGNTISGTIPGALGSLSSLKQLYLASNKLSGTIPSSIAKLAYSTTIDLAHNSLGGEVPRKLCGMGTGGGAAARMCKGNERLCGAPECRPCKACCRLPQSPNASAPGWSGWGTCSAAMAGNCSFACRRGSAAVPGACVKGTWAPAPMCLNATTSDASLQASSSTASLHSSSSTASLQASSSTTSLHANSSTASLQASSSSASLHASSSTEQPASGANSSGSWLHHSSVVVGDDPASGRGLAGGAIAGIAAGVTAAVAGVLAAAAAARRARGLAAKKEKSAVEMVFSTTEPPAAASPPLGLVAGPASAAAASGEGGTPMQSRMAEMSDEKLQPIPAAEPMEEVPSLRETLHFVWPPLQGIKETIAKFEKDLAEGRSRLPAGLEEEAALAIVLYTSEVQPRQESIYYRMNHALRSRYRCDAGRWMSYAWHLTKAMRALPMICGQVFRGIRCVVDTKDYAAGADVCWNSFTSTSMNRKVAADFLNVPGTLFEIEVARGRDIGALNHYGETEVLLEAGSRFHVDSVDRNVAPLDNVVLLIRMHEVDSDSLLFAEGAI
eukprot:m51a1_g5016 hypothetical protein (811) ;mRNA; f:278086-281436